MDNKGKINYIVVFSIVFAIIGFISGYFFTFFPGSNFILLLLGFFVGIVLGFFVSWFINLRDIDKEKRKYKI